VSGRRQVSVDAADAACTAAALGHIAAWLHGAPQEVIASLACSAYGEPTARAMGWARDLARDLRYYSAVLSSAARADPDPDPDPDRSVF
jgi:hypothetical protein